MAEMRLSLTLHTGPVTTDTPSSVELLVSDVKQEGPLFFGSPRFQGEQSAALHSNKSQAAPPFSP